MLLTVYSDPSCDGFPYDEIIPLPHETNCSLYWECFHGSLTLQECPSGLWYSEIIQSCDFPVSSDCTAEKLCRDNSTHYYPDPYDCAQYIECYLGDSYLMNCPPGLWFSVDQQQCVDPAESDCGKERSTTTSAPTTPPWTTPHPVCWGVLPGQIKVSSYPGDCRKYYMCNGASLSVHTCPDGLFFNAEKNLCDFRDLVDCDQSTTTADPWSTTQNIDTTTRQGDEDERCRNGQLSYWPVPEDCTKYIECYGGFAYTLTCPPGLYYSEELQQCVDPQLSECGKTTTTEPSTTTRHPSWTPDPRCAPYEGSGRYFFPYEGDCTKFIECYRGEYNVFECPDGLWFNPTLLVCDYPYEAGCEWGRSLFGQ